MSDVRKPDTTSLQDEAALWNLIRTFLWYQSTNHPDRWYSMQEIIHVLFPFGAWDLYDVPRAVIRMVETGEIEKSQDLTFRWKVQQ